MLELRIRINPENAEKVIRLIREIMETDFKEPVAEIGSLPEQSSLEQGGGYLSPPPELASLKSGSAQETTASKYVGTWGQFNSYFPLKATLRVISHAMKKNNGNPANLKVVVDESLRAFKEANLQKFRGFPKNYKRDSSVGRLVGHFITTALELGLITADGEISAVPNSWEKTSVSVTREGWEFARLDNKIFDWKSKDQVLTDAEKAWIVEYLKRIDAAGFKEYTVLRQVFQELKVGNTDVSGLLEKNELFRQYIKTWSRKKEDEVGFENQLKTVAVMFAQSKIALLRELGAIKNQRGDFSVIGELGD